jgi:hypothetical protein
MPKSKIEMHTLLLCTDVPFLGVTRNVLNNLAEFLRAVRHSKLNQDCVLVAIVRDLLDLKQAFAAGVHLLIHKPASAVPDRTLPADGVLGNGGPAAQTSSGAGGDSGFRQHSHGTVWGSDGGEPERRRREAAHQRAGFCCRGLAERRG